MALPRSIMVLGLSLIFLTAAQVWASCDGNQVVAKVGDQAITKAELQSHEAGKLLNARYEYYLTQRKALDQMIDQALLKQEAEREHLSVAQLLKRQLKIQQPSEDALRAFYQGMETRTPYAVMRPRILQHLRELRTNIARADYIKQLREKTMVATDLQPPKVKVALGNAPSRGPTNAPVTLVEFADYQCPYCRAIYPELQKLEHQFHDRLRVVYKDMPLPMHQYAEKAAEAARCARQQGKFWQFHDHLFVASDLDVPHLKELASKLGLNSKRFHKCLDSGSQAKAVTADLDQGKKLGITGTPGLFINGHFVSGAVSYHELSSLVDQELSQQEAQERAASAL